MVDDLFPDLLEIAVKLVDCIVDFTFFGFDHCVLLLLQLTLSFVQLFFAFTTGLLVDLVLAVALRKVEVAVVQD